MAPTTTKDHQSRRRAKTVHLVTSSMAGVLEKTLVRARRLRDLLTFLVAWFFLSDAIATVSDTAILFAKTSLGMAPASLAMINIVVMLSGVAGTLFRNRVSQFSNLRPSQTVVVAWIFISELIPLYALLGYIPAVKRLGFIGLQQPWEKYPLGFVYGTLIAGISSHCVWRTSASWV